METTPKKAATLKQVAEMAEVSMATASLVVNRKGEISEETRNRVLQAMEKLSYIPKKERSKNDAAAQSASSSLKTVRFLKIVRHGQTVNRDHNVFISDYIDGMSLEATRLNYSLQVVTHDNKEVSEIIDELPASELNGIIALGTELSDKDIKAIVSHDVPNVIIDTHRPFLDGNFVNMDNDQLVFQALEYLYQQNFRRIGLVSSCSSVMNFKLRHDAFLRGMANLGLDVDPKQILSVTSTLSNSCEESLDQLQHIASLADAYLCANDIVAIGFTRALRKLGLSVPEDVSVIGVDNLPMAAAFEPPLTSLNVPKQKIGTMAMRILDDLINNDSPQPSFKLLLAGDLVLRESVAKNSVS